MGRADGEVRRRRLSLTMIPIADQQPAWSAVIVSFLKTGNNPCDVMTGTSLISYLQTIMLGLHRVAGCDFAHGHSPVRQVKVALHQACLTKEGGCMAPAKLVSVLSLRIASRLNSLSLIWPKGLMSCGWRFLIIRDPGEMAVKRHGPVDRGGCMPAREQAGGDAPQAVKSPLVRPKPIKEISGP